MMPVSLERHAARLYRRIFVDLTVVAKCLARELPRDASVLDIGGGDGDLLNILLAARPDISVTMVDIAQTVGRFLEPKFLSRVDMVPRTTISDHIASMPQPYSAAIMCDVLHHIPQGQRRQFLSDLGRALQAKGVLFVKDVEPKGFVASLGLYADRYVSGDRGVSLVRMDSMAEMVEAVFPGSAVREVGLYPVEFPNYLLKINLT